MKKIIFHTGLPKTGTSSIQHFLLKNRERLAQSGTIFPIQNMHIDSQVPHADMFLHFYDTKAKLESSGINWSTLFDEFRENRDAERLIISYETQSVSTRQIRKNAYRDSIGSSEALFVTYLREPLSWLNSLYIETISSLYPFSEDPEKMPAIQSYINLGFKGMLAPFSELGSQSIHSYERVRKENRLIEHFLEVCGVKFPPDLHRSEIEKNKKSLRRDQVILLKSIKKVGISPSDFLELRDYMLQINRANGRLRSNDWVLPVSLSRRILGRWKSEIRYINDEFGLQYDDTVEIKDFPHNMYLGPTAEDRLRKELSQHCEKALLDLALSEMTGN